jgi:hypothetical protein
VAVNFPLVTPSPSPTSPVVGGEVQVEGKEKKATVATALPIATGWKGNHLTAPALSSHRQSLPVTPFARGSGTITAYTMADTPLPYLLHYQMICDGTWRGAPATFEVSVTPHCPSTSPTASIFSSAVLASATSVTPLPVAGPAKLAVAPPSMSMSGSIPSPAVARHDSSDIDSDTDSLSRSSSTTSMSSMTGGETNDLGDDDGVLIRAEDLIVPDASRDCIRVLEAVRLSATQVTLAARRRFPAPNRQPSLLDAKSAVKLVAAVSFITEWLIPEGVPIYTVYYQGMGASQTQLAKYVGSKGFLSTTGERVSIGERGIEVIHSPWIGRELEEVIPQSIARATDSSNESSSTWIWNRIAHKTHKYLSGSRNNFFGINIFPTEAAPDDRRRAAARAVAAAKAASTTPTEHKRGHSKDLTSSIVATPTNPTATTSTATRSGEHKTSSAHTLLTDSIISATVPTVEGSQLLSSSSSTPSVSTALSPSSSTATLPLPPDSPSPAIYNAPQDATTDALLTDRYSSPDSITPLAATLESHSIHVHMLNIGQDRDIKEHQIKMDLLSAALATARTLPSDITAMASAPITQSRSGTPSTSPGSPLTWSGSGQRGDYPPCILYGVSRGAATTFNALCTHQYSNVRLVILEGIFDSIPTMLPIRFPRTSSLALSALERLTSFRRDGPSPITLAEKCPAHIPLVFISSKIDTEVPLASTRKLIDYLMKRGQNAIYHLVLDRSSHAGYPLENAQDRTAYATLLHAIYRRYRLPHIVRLADAGRSLLISTQLCDASNAPSSPPSHLRRTTSE